MARTINAIFEEIKAEAINLATDAADDSMLAMFNNTSKVAVWKMLFYAVAFGVYVLETLIDLLKVEIDEKIKKLKPFSPYWYAEIAKAFQYGLPLIVESDTYDNTGLTQAQIDSMKIITHAAVVPQDRGIRIKVAKTVGDDLGALTAGELTSFSAYMERVKAAGIKLRITSDTADDLKSALRIYYDPLVLTDTGARIDGTDLQPVQNAMKTYLKNLPFNGLFVPELMKNQIEKVSGVVIVKDDLWQARYGINDFANIDVEYIPDAGYLRIDDINLSLQFIPHAVI